jgi:hypothetical protein
MLAEGTCWEPKKKQADVEAQAGSGVRRNTVNSTDRVKLQRFNESMSWVMFCHQFEAVAGQNNI